MQYVILNNGVKMPIEGYGTYRISPDNTERYVEMALEFGYRSIDTAQCYGNEVQVGQACKNSGIPRENIFITTKLWNCFDYKNTLKSISYSLNSLNIDYIDLLLIHEPHGDIYQIYKAMEESYAKGQVRAIGVSNFLKDNYLDLVTHCEIIPAVNQMETHIFRQQRALINIEKNFGTHHESWSPLAAGKENIFQHSVLLGIAKHHNKTPAQIALRFLGSVDTNFDNNKKMGIFILETNSNKGVENENTHDYRRTI